MNHSMIGVALVMMIFSTLWTRSLWAHPGWGIIVDQQAQIYFGDVVTNTIWKIHRDGRLQAVATGKHSHALFLDAGGNLYGEHVYYDAVGKGWISSIWKLTPDGQLMDLIPPTRGPPKGSGLFMDTQGNIYSVRGGASQSEEVALLKRTPDGQVTTLAGGTRGHADGQGPLAQFMNIVGMAWGPDGSLYVTDRSCVRQVTPEGVVTTRGGDPLAAVERSRYPRLLGLVVDSQANVYVADYEYHCLRQIRPDERVRTVLREGFFWSPSGVAAVGQELYVLEHHPESPIALLSTLGFGPYARVRRLSPNGSVTTVVNLWGSNTRAITGALFSIVALVLLAWRIRRRRLKSREVSARR